MRSDLPARCCRYVGGFSRLSPVPSVLSNLVFLNVFPEGQAYTEAQHRAWLEAAGFRDIVFDVLPDGRGSVRARKPEAGA